MDDKYAFLMVYFNMPEFIKDLQDEIPEGELYTEENNDDYGFEKETHVTLVPCLDNDIDLEKLKENLLPLNKYEVMLTDISMFPNEKFDVLKCSAQSDLLKSTNKKIIEKYPSHSEYSEYNPHVTIAYLKKGLADKYVKDMLSPLHILKPKKFVWSYYDENGDNKRIEFKN